MSDRMEKTRRFVETAVMPIGEWQAEVLAEVEEWETRMLNLEVQGISDALGFRDTALEEAKAERDVALVDLGISRDEYLTECETSGQLRERAEVAEAERDRLKAEQEQLHEQAQWLLNHWTEPAFVRPEMQEKALALARAALGEQGDV